MLALATLELGDMAECARIATEGQAAAKDRLGDSVFQTTLAEGRTLSLSGAIQFDLEDAAS